MNDKKQKLLTDIDIAIKKVNSFCSDANSFEKYSSDQKTKSAVERQLAIIGEAANKLSQLQPKAELSRSKEMISFRNRIIHSYDSIDDSVVWAILKIHLPVLASEVAALLKNFNK